MRKMFVLLLSLFVSVSAYSADYKIDIAGQHAFVNFKINHLGYSWITGTFKKFDGSFSYDKKNPSAARFNIEIDTASVDSNHALRDKHIRSADFLNVATYPKATFVSTSYTEKANGKGTLKGKFTLNGVSKNITIRTEKIGEGKDPWGGYRVGFSGKYKLNLKTYNIKKDLGPKSKAAYLEFHIEGVRKK